MSRKVKDLGPLKICGHAKPHGIFPIVLPGWSYVEHTVNGETFVSAMRTEDIPKESQNGDRLQTPD